MTRDHCAAEMDLEIVWKFVRRRHLRVFDNAHGAIERKGKTREERHVSCQGVKF